MLLHGSPECGVDIAVNMLQPEYELYEYNCTSECIREGIQLYYTGTQGYLYHIRSGDRDTGTNPCKCCSRNAGSILYVSPST